VLVVLDVDDTSASSLGTVHKATVSALPVVQVVQPSGGTNGTADAAAINAAVSALPSQGGTIVLGPGNWYLVPGAVVIEPGNSQAVVIDGRGGAVISAVSGTAGDVLRMYNPATQVGNYDGNAFSMRSGVRGVTIDGTSAMAGSTGLHIGDLMNPQVDVVIQNFSGTGDIGLHLDNTVVWTEQADIRTSLVNNTSNVVMEVTTGDPSYGYGNFDFSFQAYPGQDGLVIKSGAFPYSGHIKMRGNFGASATFASNAVLRVTGVAPGGSVDPGAISQVWATVFDVDVECNQGPSSATAGPYTIYIDSVSGCSIYGCTGQFNFNSTGGTFHAANAVAGGDFQFFGPVLGDSTINFSIVGWPVNFQGAVGIGNYASAQTLTNGATVTLSGGLIPVTCASAVTGVILTGGGGEDGQLLGLYNTGSYPVTFAASGTSNVADGASDVIPAGQLRFFLWSANASLWYPVSGEQFTARLASTFTAPHPGTAAQNVTGLAAFLGVGTWKVRAYLPYQGASAGTTHFGFTFGGTAGTGSIISWKSNLIATPFSTPVTSTTITTVSSTSATLTTSPGPFYEVTMTIVVTAAGTLQLQVYNGTTGDDTEVLAGAFLEATQTA